MLKFFMFFITATLLVPAAHAAGAQGGCVGTYHNKKVVFKGFMSDVHNKNSLRGTISVDGRAVADFDGEDLSINFLFQTFKAKNNQGALVEGHANNILKKTGAIKRLYVPGFGIDYRNIAMACWSKR